MLPREALWQPATPRLGIPAELVPSHAASIARPDRINPRLQEKRLHRLLSPVETLCCHIHILLTLQGKDPSDSYLSVHIFWACFPVGRSPLAQAQAVMPLCPLSTFLQLCFSVPPWTEDWGSRANRHSTQWTRQIIFVEGRDRDRLSHNSHHHHYFTPSREPSKSLWFIQIIISRR